jgi:hypothetical protein
LSEYSPSRFKDNFFVAGSDKNAEPKVKCFFTSHRIVPEPPLERLLQSAAAGLHAFGEFGHAGLNEKLQGMRILPQRAQNSEPPTKMQLMIASFCRAISTDGAK